MSLADVAPLSTPPDLDEAWIWAQIEIGRVFVDRWRIGSGWLYPVEGENASEIFNDVVAEQMSRAVISAYRERRS
ncbi:hypothetical protein RM543_18870 [Roseicyclus sp. F158]|uniref:Uncharacterized protein n=1 Tax=Tropicimonas omnivorans TaxID=3075590 RepID=A0ABU3DLX6_9RHOB|nr:hypothetical protein [Roseicyclus sp. F158]MDT0684721.1 hypothetical protein [Roseicyclus sp. F158]